MGGGVTVIVTVPDSDNVAERVIGNEAVPVGFTEADNDTLSVDCVLVRNFCVSLGVRVACGATRTTHTAISNVVVRRTEWLLLTIAVAAIYRHPNPTKAKTKNRSVTLVLRTLSKASSECRQTIAHGVVHASCRERLCVWVGGCTCASTRKLDFGRPAAAVRPSLGLRRRHGLLPGWIPYRALLGSEERLRPSALEPNT